MKLLAFNLGKNVNLYTYNENDDGKAICYFYDYLTLNIVVKKICQQKYDIVAFTECYEITKLSDGKLYEEAKNVKKFHSIILPYETNFIVIRRSFGYVMTSWTGVENEGISISKNYCQIFHDLRKTIEKNKKEKGSKIKIDIGLDIEYLSRLLGIDYDSFSILQGYGSKNNEIVEKIKELKKGGDREQFLSYLKAQKFHEDKNYNFKKDKLDFLRSFNYYLASQIVNLFKKNFNDGDSIAYGGEGAIFHSSNIIVDGIYNLSINKNPKDENIAFGCIKLAMYLNNIDFQNINFDYNIEYNTFVRPNDFDIKQIAKLLADGHYIALAVEDNITTFWGKRIILINPSKGNSKNVAYNYWWEKEATGVIIDSSIIKDYKKSALDPYILKEYELKEAWRKDSRKFKRITRKDKLARLQVLDKEQSNGEFAVIYKIIEEFYKLTGLPGLITIPFRILDKKIPVDKMECLMTWSCLPEVNFLFMDELLVRSSIETKINNVYKFDYDR